MSGLGGGPFRGRFDIKLDPKGRIGLPPAYRQNLISSANHSKALEFVITNGRYRGRSCLDVYSVAEWERLERRIAKLPSLKPEVQAFNRFYLSGGQPVETDSQNRVLIPQGLRRYAGIESQVVLVGLGSKFEVWSADSWSAVYDQLTISFDETVAAVAALEAVAGEVE